MMWHAVAQAAASAPAARQPLAALNGPRTELPCGGSAAKRARSVTKPGSHGKPPSAGADAKRTRGGAVPASGASPVAAPEWPDSDDDYDDFVD